VSRRPGAAYGWSDESLARGVRESDAVIHLAGENIFDKRWNPRRRKRSRLLARRDDEEDRRARRGAQAALLPVRLGDRWYGTSETATFDERSPRGSDFMRTSARSGRMRRRPRRGRRAHVPRAHGIVLGGTAARLTKMLPFFRLGIGGPLGSGRQWFSWVHVDDLCALSVPARERRSIGAYDGTSPNPVTNKELARAIGACCTGRARAGPRADAAPDARRGRERDGHGPESASRRAQEAGFRFEHPEIEEALRGPAREEESARTRKELPHEHLGAFWRVRLRSPSSSPSSS
jgi:NAD dependent epimerase/dehydratase family enzyme